MLQPLLHNAQFITKYRKSYYKMRKLLQNALLLQNAAEHLHHAWDEEQFLTEKLLEDVVRNKVLTEL